MIAYIESLVAKNKSKKTLRKQFVNYLIAAGLGYIVDFGTLYVLHDFLSVHYLIAAAISFILGLAVVYVTSSIFVFGNSKINSKYMEIGLFAFIGVIGLGILSILMYVFTGIFGINYLISKIIATVFLYIWNFFARRSLYHN